MRAQTAAFARRVDRRESAIRAATRSRTRQGGGVGAGISSILSFAVGVAVSPVPILAGILMLFSARARVSGPVFLLGWVLALGVFSGVAFALGEAGDASSGGTTSDSIAWSKIVFGLILLGLAMRSWRRRPAPGEAAPMPTWMAGIDGFTPVKAFGIAVLLAGVNPKNLMLSVAAGTSVSALGLTSTQSAVSLVVFVVVASLSIAIPVLWFLLGGAKAQAGLHSFRDWLTLHNDAVMALLLLVFGVSLISQGIPSLG
jgi:hypothetical protein